MKRYLTDKKTLKTCRIAGMLTAAKKQHKLSFHTPGHKIGAEDITELAFSDNLSCPNGCILQAEREIAKTLGAEKSFILTDGSTSGVLAMLYAAKMLGAKKVAFPESAHKSVWNGCAMLGLEALTLSVELDGKIPLPATRYALNGENAELCKQADALLFTSPDYYGNVCDLTVLRAFCDRENKWLLIDGAHGGHLHFEKTLHASGFADMWVDGVHKSLPAFTQGAVVSARTEKIAAALQESVDMFRTTSPSYPIMASVEYAVKFPRNLHLEREVIAFQNTWKKLGRIYAGEDWTKLCAVFGDAAFDVDKALQSEGIYSEFCDGNVVMFYLSPATKIRDFQFLKKRLEKLFVAYPLPSFEEKTAVLEQDKRQNVQENTRTEWLEIDKAEGRICAKNCGLFPPCSPILIKGETVTAENIALLMRADNVYGLNEKRICVYVSEQTNE